MTLTSLYWEEWTGSQSKEPLGQQLTQPGKYRQLKTSGVNDRCGAKQYMQQLQRGHILDPRFKNRYIKQARNYTKKHIGSNQTNRVNKCSRKHFSFCAETQPAIISLPLVRTAYD